MSTKQITPTTLNKGKQIRLSRENYEYLARNGTCTDSFNSVLTKLIEQNKQFKQKKEAIKKS